MTEIEERLVSLRNKGLVCSSSERSPFAGAIMMLPRRLLSALAQIVGWRNLQRILGTLMRDEKLAVRDLWYTIDGVNHHRKIGA